MFFIENLYAAGAKAPSGGAALAQFLPLILIFIVFYFLLIRPQQKKQKEHREMLMNLKKGDEVITAGGIYGKIVGVTEQVLTLEVAENVKIKVNRNYIARKVTREPQKND